METRSRKKPLHHSTPTHETNGHTEEANPPLSNSQETQSQHEKLAPFEFHGVFFTDKGTHSLADCPFCGREAKFFVNNTTGQWDCKVCGEYGNTISFLRRLAEYKSSHSNVEKGLEILAKKRGLPKNAFFGWGIGCEEDYSRFYLPVYSVNKPNTIVSLRVWDGSGPVLATAGTKNSLLLAENLHTFSKSKTIFLCEGDWDAYALDWLRVKLDLDICVLGVPGASTSLKPYLEKFHGKEVVLVYDADDPGFTGQEKASTLIAKATSDVKCILWDGVPGGYDINQFISDNLKKPKQAWKHLQSIIKPRSEVYSSPEKEETPDTPRVHRTYDKVPSYKELEKIFIKELRYFDKDMRDALVISLASVLSIRVPGVPIWIFLVGASGSSKSLILESLNGSDYCQYESILRPAALVSGMGEDCSLIPKLKNLCLVVRDYSVTISQDRAAQEHLYGILLEAYDGEFKVQFGNGELRHYKDNFFSFVAGTTQIIYSEHRVAMGTLGERFLKCELVGDRYDGDEHVRAAILGQNRDQERKQILGDIVGAFLSQPIPNSSKLPKIPEWLISRVIGLSQVVSYLRASVEYSRATGDINYRPRPAAGTRLGKQLVKLARCIAIVLGRPIDKECYRLVEKVAFDTAHGFHLDIIKALMTSYPRPLSRAELASRCTLKERTIDLKIQSLLELHAVVRSPTPIDPKTRVRSIAGRPTMLYKPSPVIVELWKKAKISL